MRSTTNTLVASTRTSRSTVQERAEQQNNHSTMKYYILIMISKITMTIKHTVRYI